MADGQLVTPAVPDLACVEGETVAEAVEWLTHYYVGEGCPRNYRTGTKSIKAGYKGLHRLDLLLAACAQERTKQGRISNGEIIRLAAPLAFGRATQVFDLPPRQFAFGRKRHAAYRIPFFFVERGVVKLYYVQPRKEHGPRFDQLGMVAKIHKQYLLDTEFFGQVSDVEYVSLGAEETVDGCQNPHKDGAAKKVGMALAGTQPLLAVEPLVANDGWAASPVKAVSRRRRGPQARLYRACHPAILGHRGRRLTTATRLPSPSLRGFTPPATETKGPRVVRSYSLDSLDIWSDKRLADRLSLISEALDRIEERGTVRSRRRPARPEPEMPLFD